MKLVAALRHVALLAGQAAGEPARAAGCDRPALPLEFGQEFDERVLGRRRLLWQAAARSSKEGGGREDSLVVGGSCGVELRLYVAAPDRDRGEVECGGSDGRDDARPSRFGRNPTRLF